MGNVINVAKQRISENNKKLEKIKKEYESATNDFSRFLLKEKIALIEEEILFSERLLKTFENEEI